MARRKQTSYSFLYFEWLLDKVCDDNHHRVDYRSLLEALWRRKYDYIPVFMDKNRASDGLALRGIFNSCNLGQKLSPDEMSMTVTVLEVLIALSMRIETDILCDSNVGNRTAVWFWTIMENMDLHVMDERRFDEYYIDQVLDKFVKRTYGPNGEGGPFYIPYSVKDLRQVELWKQAMWYITANFA